MSYKLVPHHVSTLRTDQWNPRSLPETVWFIEGPALNRPATDVEILIVQDVIERALKAVARFDDLVNHKPTADMPGTPGEAIRKEFGL